MDETQPLRTVAEQVNDPYPKSLITMCATPDWERNDEAHIEWREPEWEWAESMVYCHILDRTLGDNGDYVYDVSLLFFKSNLKPFKPEEYEYDPSISKDDLYIDYKVPRRAIRWSEKPYLDDEHLENVFRHPITFPEDLVARAWETVT